MSSVNSHDGQKHGRSKSYNTELSSSIAMALFLHLPQMSHPCSVRLRSVLHSPACCSDRHRDGLRRSQEDSWQSRHSIAAAIAFVAREESGGRRNPGQIEPRIAYPVDHNRFFWKKRPAAIPVTDTLVGMTE